FDALGRLHVPLHGAVQPHVRRRDDAFDAAPLADRQQAALLVERDHVAADVPVDVQTALEFDVALDARVRADQRAGGRLSALLSKHRQSFLRADTAQGRPIERLRQGLSGRLRRPYLDFDPERLESDGQRDFLLEALKVAEIVLELGDLRGARQLLETERLRLPVQVARQPQSYNAGRLAVLRDRLHQHDAEHIALLAVAGCDLDALHAKACLPVGRRDDTPIERELLLLRLQLRFELGQRDFDLRVGLAVDLARRFEHRELPLELVDQPRLLARLAAQPLDLATVIEQRVAGLIAAELEHEVRGAE